MKTFAPGWIAFILVRNAALVLAVFGFFHLRSMSKGRRVHVQVQRKMAGSRQPAFLFRDQTIDNMIWVFASAVPIWTAYEVVTLWAFANGYIGFLHWNAHPVFFVVLMLLIPLIRELHFYLIHRLFTGHRCIAPCTISTTTTSTPAHGRGSPCIRSSICYIFPACLFTGSFLLIRCTHCSTSCTPGSPPRRATAASTKSWSEPTAQSNALRRTLSPSQVFRVQLRRRRHSLDKWFGTFHDGTEEFMRR